MVQHSPNLIVGQLVCITQYHSGVNDVPQIGPALAVGYMALTGDQVRGSGKGKAVNIVHTWKDHLWEKGGKEDPPAPRIVELNQKTDPEVGGGSSTSGDPDVPAGTKLNSSGEGSLQPHDEPPAMPPKEEINPLSQQGEISRISWNHSLTGKPRSFQYTAVGLTSINRYHVVKATPIVLPNLSIGLL